MTTEPAPVLGQPVQQPEPRGGDAVADDLEFALRLADLADRLTLAGHQDQRSLKVAAKPDLSPVTNLDREVELALRRHILQARPDDGVVGEEFGPGGVAAADGGRWILDPIDNTKGYVRRSPVFATLIAYERDAVVQVGVCSAPALRRRWWAGRGLGAYRSDGLLRMRPFPGPARHQHGGDRISVSEVAELAAAQLNHSDFLAWDAHQLLDRFVDLARRCGRRRGPGDFWGLLEVAEGVADVAVEAEPVGLHDLAAIQVIVAEAGGRLTDLQGRARIDGGGPVLASNGLLHDQVLAVLGVG
jgi:histidinol-phosphatase